jgi:hypothetical protein
LLSFGADLFCAAVFYPKNINIKTHGPVSLSVLCGCETWSLILREELTVRVLENRVPRKIFGPKRDKVTGVEKTT